MRTEQVLRFVKLAVFVIVGVCVLSCACYAAKFSAERVIRSGRMTVTSKCYVRGSSSRSETTMGSQKRIIINRPDKGILWMLNPAKKEYVERKCQPAYTGYVERLVKKGGKKKLIGIETVSGQQCEKYLISFSNKVATTTTVWISRKLNHPIKIESKSENLIYRNIREGKLPDSLFEVPKGYRAR